MEELAKSKLEPPKQLAELAQRHWGELDAGTRVWNRPTAEVAVLRHASLADLCAFFEVRRSLCLCPLLSVFHRVEAFGQHGYRALRRDQRSAEAVALCDISFAVAHASHHESAGPGMLHIQSRM